MFHLKISIKAKTNFPFFQVDEIMMSVKSAFKSAFEQNKLHMNQICTMCPLHQLQKLCQEINGKGISLFLILAGNLIRKYLTYIGSMASSSFPPNQPMTIPFCVPILVHVSVHQKLWKTCCIFTNKTP